MHVSIVIPTFQRILKLTKCLESIKQQTHKDLSVYIFADNNDMTTAETIAEEYPEHYITVNSTQKYVSGSWNNYFKLAFKTHYYSTPEIMAWIVDDVVLHKDCLANAVESMIKYYPDTDGIIGLKQECPGRPDYTFKWFGQMLIGREFIERYKEVDYQLYCPDYTHFHGTEEIFQYANSLGKFKNCPEAVLDHYHPSFNADWKDATHDIVRSQIIQKDKATWKTRQQKELVWGKTWDLINEK